MTTDLRERPLPTALRRRQLIQGLTAGGVLSLAGCSGPDRSVPPSSATRQIQADNGAVSVPTNPARVVVTDNYLISTLYDLDLKPIGIPSGQLEANIFPDEILRWLGTPAEIGPSGKPDSETVLALEPDLILDQFYPDQTQALSDLAPVVFVDWRRTGRTWQQQVRLIASAVNREDQLTEKEDRYTETLARIRSTYPRALAEKVWAFAAGGQGGDWILGSTAVAVLTDLGANLLPGLTSTFVSHSLEKVDLLAEADVLLYPRLFDGSIPPPTARLRQNRLWQRLPAVASGRSFPISYSAVSCHHWARQAVTEIEEILADLTRKA